MNDHIFISVDIEGCEELIRQLNMALEVAKKAYTLDKKNVDEEGYEPQVRIKIESKDYGDRDYDVTVNY